MEITVNDERRDEVVTCFAAVPEQSSAWCPEGARPPREQVEGQHFRPWSCRLLSEGPRAREPLRRTVQSLLNSPRGENVIERPVQRNVGLCLREAVSGGKAGAGPRLD